MLVFEWKLEFSIELLFDNPSNADQCPTRT